MKNITLEDCRVSEDFFKITLSANKNSLKRKYPRLFVLSGSYKIGIFSITSFEIHNNSKNHEEFNQIYNLKVEGNHDLNKILTELKNIIHGKELFNIKPNFPF